VEEYAALQTFPRDYTFSGTLDDQYRQIGNAVPCLFAQAIGKHIKRFDAGAFVDAPRPARLSRYINTDEASWVGATTEPFLPGLFAREEGDAA
jgi:DNA (cytosine-5)-methyltransferase 1